MEHLPYYFISAHYSKYNSQLSYKGSILASLLYTKLLLIFDGSADTLHEGAVDPKEALGFQPALQKSISLSQHFSML